MRKQFSKSDIKSFLQDLPLAAPLLSKKSLVVLEDDCLFIDGRLCFLHIDGRWIPSLRLLLDAVSLLPAVVVDKGAIKFVVNGADVMRPGIVRVDIFLKDAVVVVVDETFGKPLAVGKALFSSQELLNQTSGKSVALIHHIGDAYWEKG